MKKLFLLSGLVAAMTLAGCSTVSTNADVSQNSSPIIEGTTLMWAEGVNDGCELPPTITFDKGKVNGNAGCNNFFGGYAAKNDELTFSKMGMTMRLCGKAFMEVEGRFLAALEATRFAVREGDSMTLLDADKKPLIKLVSEAPGRCE